MNRKLVPAPAGNRVVRLMADEDRPLRVPLKFFFAYKTFISDIRIGGLFYCGRFRDVRRKAHMQM